MHCEKGCSLQALSKLVGTLPANVTAAVVSQHGGFQRQEEILARTEHLLAVYESKVNSFGAQGGKQFGASGGVPNLFVGGTAVVGCGADDAVPATVGPCEQQIFHKMKTSSAKDKGTLVESAAAAAAGKGGSIEDNALQPDISNSQLQFLQCLQNSQDPLPDHVGAVGASQENLFPSQMTLSQPTTGATDPLMHIGTPLSQGPWVHGSDPLAGGPTTSQLLASQPASMAPTAGENDGGQ